MLDHCALNEVLLAFEKDINDGSTYVIKLCPKTEIP